MSASNRVWGGNQLINLRLSLMKFSNQIYVKALMKHLQNNYQGVIKIMKIYINRATAMRRLDDLQLVVWCLASVLQEVSRRQLTSYTTLTRPSFLRRNTHARNCFLSLSQQAL